MEEINALRKQIDSVDEEIYKSLSERKLLVQKIKKIKKDKAIAVKDPSREAEILAKSNSDYEKEIFSKILEESRKLQSEQ